MIEAQTKPAAEVGRERDNNRGRMQLGVTIVAGHALKHLYNSGFAAIILPEIKLAFGLNGAQVGTLATVRQFSGWTTTLGSGYLGDRFSHRTGLMLGLSLGIMGIAYFLVGIAPGYAFLLGILPLAGMGPSMFHPPAIGALSRRFPDRRAFAISMHGAGGSVGEAAGPLVASGLLLVLTWQGVMRVSMIPALIAAVVLWRVIGNLEMQEGGATSFQSYLASLKEMLRKRALLLLVLITALRSMGQSSITLFLPVYLREDLSYEATTVGLFLSMAQIVGIGSQPAMGYLSDRFGHKPVLVPAMIILGSLCLSLTLVEGTIPLALTIVAMGGFLYSLHSIFVSAAISVAGEGAQSTTVSLMYGASFLGTLSPIIAGILTDQFGTRSAFLYAAIMVFIATTVFTFMRFPHRNVQEAST